MSPIVISYRTRPDSADENEAHVKAVFAQLHQSSPDGLRYACLRLDDDTFVHIAHIVATDNPLLELDAFAEFTATVAARCEPECRPVSRQAHLIGDYRLFG
jgi:hypothetical protein